MNFIDLFSGIGGLRSALEKNGHKCLAYSEIDKFAKQSYQAIYSTENEVDLDDITKVSDEYFRSFREKCDIIVGGFPCQAFSIAGNRRGFEDTRGTLFFHIARAIKEIKPSFVLLENVKGLFSHDKGRTFGTIIQALDELGYVVEWQLFNSKYWGVPQNRERVYILVTRKDVFKRPILFDLGQKQKSVNTRLIDVLENDVGESYFLSDEKIAKLTLNDDLSGKLNYYNYRELDTVHSTKKVAPTLNTMQGGERQPKIAIPVLTPDRVNKRQNGRRFKENGEAMFTLTAQDRHGIAIKEATKKGYAIATKDDNVNYTYPTSTTRRGRVGKQVAQTLQAGEVNQATVLNDLRIRKLTPLECWRLQGFTDEQFYKAKNDGVSNSQLYKQAGNAVTVNVVDAIISKIDEYKEDERDGKD
ncbi:DNA (cytosine-5-)-methyltransferase [Staphylococcus agnetis]|uniref:Cytosine-specific methyltransferase n=1 Tax=Staphylococcus agnetis TaxID=985762 RepID=A0ABD7TSR8_9STAP|nr:DNA (cytosine-5-)-methyltransferase [Staphylococcus agnetis]UXU56520.1 DNA (cytosine-5-)-methyltransferase [Staphylococcus agnetis]UXU58840.1 DNA (cytosine-5-)-methyltransferase [Staphylococcus agnetis]UXU61165.1 DNA (cytosine-5-)-methyltransferase [Staphylococcus agnetis]